MMMISMCRSAKIKIWGFRLSLLVMLWGAGPRIAWGQGAYPDRVLRDDNGPMITHPGGGANGADASAFQSGMITFGWALQFASGNRLADDFTVDAPGGWDLAAITVYGYQTGSGTNSTITGVYLQIWDGRPGDPGVSVVYGDLVANRLDQTRWTGIYRTSHDQLQNTQRPIMACTALVDVHLPAGTYWLDWTIDGALGSGPWGSPISILGETATGNARQFTGFWQDAIESGTNAQQGFPFKLWSQKAFELPFCEDFSTWLPEDWSLHQLGSIGDNWQSHDAAAYHDDFYGDANSWLVTPPIALPDKPGLRLRFDEKNMYMDGAWYDYSGVMVSTGSEDPADGDFEELYESNAALPNWSRTTLSLDAYAGQTVHIAFNYRGDYAHLWWVDNVCAYVLTADFDAVPLEGPAPLDVSFTDASTGEPDGWAWYFGDEGLSGTWQQITAAADWMGRDKFAAATLPDGNLVVAGGYVNVFPWHINDVWRSSDGGATWTEMTAAAAWSSRMGHMMTALPDGDLLLMGGYDNAFRNDVWCSSDQGATWSLQTAAAGWSPRGYGSLTTLPDGSVVLSGGHTGVAQQHDVWRSTNKGASWTLMTDSPGWAARSGHAVVAIDEGAILLMGGGISEHPWQVNDVWRSDDLGATWSLVTDSAPWSARANHQGQALPDNSIVVLGGNDGAFVNDVWRSTDGGASWNQVTGSAEWPARMQFVVGMPADGAMVVMGGNIGTGLGRDVWRLDTASAYDATPDHLYSVEGRYTVTLVVRDSLGTSVKRKTGYITVAQPLPVSPGASMLLDPSEWFPENDWAFTVASSDPAVVTAQITPEGQLLLETVGLGTTLITVTATNTQTHEQRSHTFWIAVAGHPDVLSTDFLPYEPWNPRFEQRFELRNTSGFDAIGVRLLFSDLADGIVVENQTGIAPDGRVMIDWIAPFPDGETETLSVVYLATGSFRPDQYPPTVEIQFILSQHPGLPENLGPPFISDFRMLPKGRKMLEFSSIPGRTYMVEYSDSGPTGPWTPVTTLTITAGANRTQWLDTGPPTIPDSTTGMRFYRVREVLP